MRGKPKYNVALSEPEGQALLRILSAMRASGYVPDHILPSDVQRRAFFRAITRLQQILGCHCTECGSFFEYAARNRNQQKYCSRRCRDRAYNKRKRLQGKKSGGRLTAQQLEVTPNAK